MKDVGKQSVHIESTRADYIFNLVLKISRKTGIYSLFIREAGTIQLMQDQLGHGWLQRPESGPAA